MEPITGLHFFYRVVHQSFIHTGQWETLGCGHHHGTPDEAWNCRSDATS
jgi:hypothetical protein